MVLQISFPHKCIKTEVEDTDKQAKAISLPDEHSETDC